MVIIIKPDANPNTNANAIYSDQLIARAGEEFVQQLRKGATAAAGGNNIGGQSGSNVYEVIEESLKKASRLKFASEFGYPYAGDESKPKAASSGSIVKGFTHFVDTAIDPTIDISICVKSLITDHLPVEEWAKEAISTDITKFTSALLAAHHAPFTYTKYQQSFTHPSQDNPGQVFIAQAAFHYGNIDIPKSGDHGHSTPYFFLYFSGVVYWVEKS